MFDPASLTLGQMSSAIRDFTIVVVLFTASWKARGVYEKVSNFITRVTNFMTSMENFTRVVVDNHLKHIEADLKTLSGRQDDIEITRNTVGEN